MPLQVLLLPDNLLTSLPKEIGKMTSLAELDASNNRLTQVPMTLGDCAGLRCLDLSNNQLGLLPLQITYLRLEHLDVSCNCISSLPLELRNMSTLITLNLDNNPLVSPPTTICMRGRVHIFKYLENMAIKDSLPAHRRVDETRRTAKHTSYISSPNSGTHQITSGNATIDCLRHKPRHVVDSGYCTDGVEKRWSNDACGEAGGGSGRSTPSTPSTLSPGAALSRAQSLSSETPLAPLTPILTGLRISPEGNISNGEDKSKLAHQQTYRQYKEALRQQRQQDVYRPRCEQPSPSPELDNPHSLTQSPVHFQKSPHSPINGYSNVSPYNRSLSSNSTPNTSTITPNSPILHSTPRRFQAQNGNQEKTEETKRPVQKVVPSRNVNKMYSSVNGNVDYTRLNGSDAYSKPISPTKSPTNTIGYNVKSNIPRTVNGDAKLLTTTVSYLKGAGAKPAVKIAWNKDTPPDKLSFTMKREFDKQKEESDLLQQLRTIIESRLKMSLPEQLAPALADGVVLCHLANHVRPRAVASVHVPSPAQPKLTMARCRRNVDNFLEACRKIGVEEEELCSPEDILSEPSVRALRPLARTLRALLAHATLATDSRPPPPPPPPRRDSLAPHDSPHHPHDSPRHPQDFPHPHDSPRHPHDFPQYSDDSRQYSHDSPQDPHDTLHRPQDYPQYQNDSPEHSYDSPKPLASPEFDTIEVNYDRRHRYSDDRYISNFNYNDHNYTFDESEEFQYDNNNDSPPTVQYSPVYNNELRVRGPYYQKNRIQFVTPFCKGDGVLKSENFEIYDTDEVDFPVELSEETVDVNRYDRGKMNLAIQTNYDTQSTIEVESARERENRIFYTCLCIGGFILSAIVLILYPL
ncbi:unnamed protein product [Euphydryas editha]|uniref:Calponin-homology (CH) domain-containing protein n=1 Tax=Euphydryas editha TaxID=104508 RepID=A0AAU9V0R7_EUPED|nr:unnamed protein product [Euphydryas editha]